MTAQPADPDKVHVVERAVQRGRPDALQRQREVAHRERVADLGQQVVGRDAQEDVRDEEQRQDDRVDDGRRGTLVGHEAADRQAQRAEAGRAQEQRQQQDRQLIPRERDVVDERAERRHDDDQQQARSAPTWQMRAAR